MASINIGNKVGVASFGEVGLGVNVATREGDGETLGEDVKVGVAREGLGVALLGLFGDLVRCEADLGVRVAVPPSVPPF